MAIQINDCTCGSRAYIWHNPFHEAFRVDCRDNCYKMVTHPRFEDAVSLWNAANPSEEAHAD